MATQAEITLNSIVRGDTMRARTVTFTVNDAEPAITSAEWHIYGLYDSPCVVNGGVVTMPAVPAEVTERWPVGTHKWDLSTTIAGVRKTYIRGTLPVLRSEE